MFPDFFAGFSGFWIALVIFTGSILHTTTGFGYGLFAIPVLLLLGLRPYEAMVIMGLSLIAHGGLSIWQMRRELPGWPVVWMAAIACAMQPVGGWLLGRVVLLNRATVSQIFGILVLVGLYAALQPVITHALR